MKKNINKQKQKMNVKKIALLGTALIIFTTSLLFLNSFMTETLKTTLQASNADLTTLKTVIWEVVA